MNFVLTLLAIWAVGVGGWYFLSRSLQTADAQKLTDRVLGTQKLGKKKGSRGGKATPSLLAEDDRITGKYVLRLLSRYRLEDRFKTLIEQAGLRWKLARLVQMSLALFLFGFAGGWLMLPPVYQPMAVAPGLVTGFLPWMYLLHVRTKRLRMFEEQFPESLEFVARSMRAGHAFSVSLEMLHREFQEPLAGEFRRTFEEHNLGLPLETALEKLAQRVPSLDVHFFVSAVLLQKRTGGNLAEILDKLAYVIRERFKLRGKIRAISAHGRMTGMALTSIPLGVAGIMFLVNPEYVRFFVVDEVGQMMAVAGVLLQVLGYLIIKKIVSIEV
jgi:tight adherence protein B